MYQALRLSICVFFTSGKAPKEPWMAKQESVRKGSRSPINPDGSCKGVWVIKRCVGLQCLLAFKQRITEVGRKLLRSLVQLTHSKQVNYSSMLRVLPSSVLNIFKDGDTTAPPGNLFHCLTTSEVRMFFLHVIRISCILPCSHCVSFYHWMPMSRV